MNSELNAAKEKLEIVSSAAPPPFQIFAGGLPRRLRRRNAFGLIQEYCNDAARRISSLARLWREPNLNFGGRNFFNHEFMKLKPIWISSVEHLNKFAEIANNSNVLQKIIGYYKIPVDFPHIRLMLIFKMPIVFFGSAEVNIEGNSISFAPLDFKTFGSQYKNIMQKQFQLNKGDIQSIERYQPPPVLMKYFMVNWVRIKTRHDIFDDDFLICVGGSGPLMSKIQDSTDSLYNELVRFAKQ